MPPSSLEGVRDLGFLVFAQACRGRTWRRLYAIAEGDVRVLAFALTLARDVDPTAWRRSVARAKVLDALMDALDLALHGERPPSDD